MSRSWEAQFEQYQGTLSGDPMAVQVDLGAGPQVPVAELGVRLRLLVHIADAGEDGLPLPAEADRLQQLEQQLAHALAEEHGAVLVGRVMVSGLADMVCYAPGATLGQMDGLRATVDRVRGETDVDLDLAPDISWKFYREVLWPDAREYNSIMTARELAVLREAGDDLSRERAVEHVVLLPGAEAAAEAKEALTRLGLEVGAPEALEPQLVRVVLREQRALEPEQMQRRTREILDAVLLCGGDYDGWSCAGGGGDAGA